MRNNEIILTEIRKVISEKKKKTGKKYGFKKTRGGGRVKYDIESYKKDNVSMAQGEQNQSEIEKILKSPAVNDAAVGRELYPRLTPGGAQSKFRKKLYNERSDSGSIYKLTTREYKRLGTILSKMGLRS